MKKLLIVTIIGGAGFYVLKRYQKHVNAMPNIEY
ncbi:SE2200 family small protein [Macrococcoides caseolyticum]